MGVFSSVNLMRTTFHEQPRTKSYYLKGTVYATNFCQLFNVMSLRKSR